MKCQCPDCSETPAPTYSVAWRAECEANLVSKMEDEERTEYIKAVTQKRGKPAADDLLQRARVEWKRARTQSSLL